jgi:hypothetical protein
MSDDANLLKKTIKTVAELKEKYLDRRRCIYICCFPKTASTFLLEAAHRVTGFPKTPLVDAYRDSEQDIYLPRLVDTAHLDIALHQHTRATSRNLELMRGFKIRPVILVRNIHDVLVSLRDHMETESPVSPFYLAHENFAALDEPGRLDMLVDLAGAWLVQFYASWYMAAAQGVVQTLWLTYEEFLADKPTTVVKMLEYYGIEAPAQRIRRVVEELEEQRGGLRFNKGVAGRGQTVLSDEQKARLAALTRHYPLVDFRLIDLPDARA